MSLKLPGLFREKAPYKSVIVRPMCLHHKWHKSFTNVMLLDFCLPPGVSKPYHTVHHSHSERFVMTDTWASSTGIPAQGWRSGAYDLQSFLGILLQPVFSRVLGATAWPTEVSKAVHKKLVKLVSRQISVLHPPSA